MIRVAILISQSARSNYKNVLPNICYTFVRVECTHPWCEYFFAYSASCAYHKCDMIPSLKQGHNRHRPVSPGSPSWAVPHGRRLPTASLTAPMMRSLPKCLWKHRHRLSTTMVVIQSLKSFQNTYNNKCVCILVWHLLHTSCECKCDTNFDSGRFAANVPQELNTVQLLRIYRCEFVTPKCEPSFSHPTCPI